MLYNILATTPRPPDLEAVVGVGIVVVVVVVPTLNRWLPIRPCSFSDDPRSQEGAGVLRLGNTKMKTSAGGGSP